MRDARTTEAGRRWPVAGRRSGRRSTMILLLALVAAASGCIAEATWTPQDVEPAADPLPDRYTLTDVACPDEGECVAIGSLATLPTASQVVVLRQDGDAWDRVSLPLNLPSAGGVSCVGPDDCVVRGVVDLHDDGNELTVLPPAPLDGNAFNGALDCVAGDGCLQVDGGSSAWWDGTNWSDPVPLPAGMMPTDRQLSCTSATHCLLVATEWGIEGWPTPGTVTSSTWDGTSWSPIVTLDHQTRALDLDCATATACFATAGVRADYWTVLLPTPVPAEVLRWDGTGWASEAITYPGGANPTEPGAVSCDSATSCTVLSVAGSGTPPSPTVLARWNGTTWTGTATDAATPATALACTSDTSCTATGGGVAQRLEGDGANWSPTTLPAGSSPAELLADVSCVAADDCVAVGSAWTLRAPSEGPLLTTTVQHFDGEGWTAEDAGDADLRFVDCATSTSCMAAGSDLGRFWSRHRDGDTWRTLPDVAGNTVGAVSGLSCPTATWCLLTTSLFAGTGDQAWVWDGGDTWTPSSALPANTGTITGLSCAAPGDCVAVSNWLGPAMHRLVNGTWAPVVEAPSVNSGGSYEDVSCPVPDTCAVVGRAGFADDGQPYSLLAVVSPGLAIVSERNGVTAIDVDCWAPDGCAAVASGANAHLDVWNGTEWLFVANPPGVVAPTAVACGAPARCEVTGSFVDGSDRSPVAAVDIDLSGEST